MAAFQAGDMFTKNIPRAYILLTLHVALLQLLFLDQLWTHHFLAEHNVNFPIYSAPMKQCLDGLPVGGGQQSEHDH